jgi:DNA-binding transcriptional MerR regulator
MISIPTTPPIRKPRRPTVDLPAHWKVKGLASDDMRIGEIATASGTTTKTLRFYEHAGLLPAPPRSPAGHRDYPPSTLDRLRFVRTAQTAGLTLAEIAGVLAIRDAGAAPCAHVTELVDRHLDKVRDRIAELRRTETELKRLARTQAKSTRPPVPTGTSAASSPPAEGARNASTDINLSPPADISLALNTTSYRNRYSIRARRSTLAS